MYISCVHRSQTTPFIRCSDSFSYVTVREGNPGQVQIPRGSGSRLLKKAGTPAPGGVPRTKYPVVRGPGSGNTPGFGISRPGSLEEGL